MRGYIVNNLNPITAFLCFAGLIYISDYNACR
nr:MAG TPA: hypothetical protein [Caudoviricetes sp.]